jgi:pimeloyl-ACP methyl ester carboxylesterase
MTLALALAERYAPGLGARLAVRMWITLPPEAPAAGRPVLAGPGVRAMVRVDERRLGRGEGRRPSGRDGRGLGRGEGRRPSGRDGRGLGRGDGRRWVSGEGRRTGCVVTESWGDGALVYLLHGWGGYRGQLGAFVRPLTEAGFRVVAVDTPGHGESGPGRYGPGRSMMPEFTAALRSAVGHYGPARGVIAHSMGATATALAALDGLDARRLVLIAPVTDPMAAIGLWAPAAGLGPRVRARMPRRIERRAGRPFGDFDVVGRAAEREELPPALIIHDTADKEVPFGLGARVAGAWPDASFRPTSGLGHRRILRDPDVIGSAVAFLGSA